MSSGNIEYSQNQVLFSNYPFGVSYDYQVLSSDYQVMFPSGNFVSLSNSRCHYFSNRVTPIPQFNLSVEEIFDKLYGGKMKPPELDFNPLNKYIKCAIESPINQDTEDVEAVEAVEAVETAEAAESVPYSRAQHIPNLHNIKCNICDIHFKTKKNLSKHLKTKKHIEAISSIEPLGEQVKECGDICQCYFEGIESHSSKWPCKKCNAKQATKHIYERHIKIHNDDIQFQCQYCPKSFNTGYNLRNHINIVHKRLIKFSCSICSVFFKHKSSMIRHMANMHGNKSIIESCFSDIET